MLRKLAIWLLLAPLPLNGLWIVCQNAPSQSEQMADASTSDPSGPVCTDTLCTLKPKSKGGSVCFVSSGGASMTIVLFGIAILPPQMLLQYPIASREPVADLLDMYRSPAAALNTPPPRV